MKMTPELKKAKDNMQPGEITSEGFLGDDKRELVDIIEQDEEMMETLGIDYTDLAEKMHYVMNEGRKGLGEPTKVDGKWDVRVDESRGFLACPFEDGIFRKINVIVKNMENNEEIIFTDMSVHLLEKHHFHQGKGTNFRLNPKKLKKVFYD